MAGESPRTSGSQGASPQFSVDFLGNLAWNFAAMFGICMLCHGELVRQRPDPRYLTAFYFMISAGGATRWLGGESHRAATSLQRFCEWDLSLLHWQPARLGLLARAAVQFV